jgi:hypothetical protein
MPQFPYRRSNHEALCGLDESQSLSLKLIDCTTLLIVCPELLPSYAALSNVWGRNTITKYARAGRIIPGSLLNAISDAITVTKEPELNFLWVDKLCID